jgi:hypothetical protein
MLVYTTSPELSARNDGFGRYQPRCAGRHDVAGHARSVPGHIHPLDFVSSWADGLNLGGEELDLWCVEQGFVIGHARNNAVQLVQSLDDIVRIRSGSAMAISPQTTLVSVGSM